MSSRSGAGDTALAMLTETCGGMRNDTSMSMRPSPRRSAIDTSIPRAPTTCTPFFARAINVASAETSSGISPTTLAARRDKNDTRSRSSADTIRSDDAATGMPSVVNGDSSARTVAAIVASLSAPFRRTRTRARGATSGAARSCTESFVLGDVLGNVVGTAERKANNTSRRCASVATVSVAVGATKAGGNAVGDRSMPRSTTSSSEARASTTSTTSCCSSGGHASGCVA
mmetsp:Transcript_28551/g.69492  ORF Transcript_28551/g.69492 Transcript_28551/m.69492 type:complete len:229 (-) Transcript_28551:844-1530(-)